MISGNHLILLKDLSFLIFMSFLIQEELTPLQPICLNRYRIKLKSSGVTCFIDYLESKKKAFYLKHKGQSANVLFESDNTGGFMHGFTENYIKVKTKFDPTLINQIKPVILDKLGEELCYEI